MTKTQTNNPPSMDVILNLPLADGARFQLDDADITRLRARIYLINSNNATGWRWRTTKIAAKTKSKNKKVRANLIHTLIVWRVK
jgi:transcriptional antiterminator Rof (Rho-off)